MDYSPWDHQESDTTEQLNPHHRPRLTGLWCRTREPGGTEEPPCLLGQPWAKPLFPQAECARVFSGLLTDHPRADPPPHPGRPAPRRSPARRCR